MVLRHTGLVVSDLSASLAFYRDLLGLKVVWQHEDAASRQVKLSDFQQGRVELIQWATAPWYGSDHVAFTVGNAAREALRFEKLQNFEDAHHVGFWTRDPDGRPVEIVEDR